MKRKSYIPLTGEISQYKSAPGISVEHVLQGSDNCESIMPTEDDIIQLELRDIINSDTLQSLMDNFYKLTHIPMAIIDMKGSVLVGVGWQDICTKFHRVHPKTCGYCIESDLKLSEGVAPGQYRMYKCKNNLWDIATPVVIDGKQLGNVFMGQFFLDDELLDYELFRSQAKKYGFNEKEYITALERVPRLNQRTVDTAMAFLTKLAYMISQQSYSNIKLTQGLVQRQAVEQALRENEERILNLAKFPEENHNPVLRITHDGKLLYANHPARTMLEEIGWQEDDLPQTLLKPVLRALKQGKNQEFELLCPSERFYSFGVAVVKDAGYANLYGRDVTSRKRVEKALRESEERLRVTLNSIGDAVITFDTDGHVMFLNPVAAKLTGWTSENAIGRPMREVFNIINEKTHKPAQDIVAKVLHHGHVVSLANHTSLVTKDGLEIPIEDSAAPIKDYQGRITGVVVVFHDISDKRRAEETARHALDDLNRAQAVAHVGSWRLDVRENKLAWSQEAHRIFGIQPGKALTYETFLSCVHPDDREYVNEKWNAALSGEYYDIEHRIVVDGKVKWVREKAELEFDKKGKLLGGFGSSQDISAQKEAEQILHNAHEVLEQKVLQRTEELDRKNIELHQRAVQLSQLASELTLTEQRERHRLAQILHDHLQQLLVGAKFGLEVLKCQLQNAQQIESLNGIHELITESITASRSLSIELSPPILHEGGLVKGIEWLVRWMEEKHGFVVDFAAGEEFIADREDIKILLFQSVRELLLNAVKHAGVTTASVELSTQNNGDIKIVVSDKGVGFSPEALMWRGDDANIGFGLFSIRERLALLGGNLTMESAAQKGSKFTLTVPVNKMEAFGETLEQIPQLQTVEKIRSDSVKKGDGGKIQIVLADDHMVVRQGLCALLHNEPDIKVVGQAIDGLQAVAMARSLHPDVILMDFSMPQMNGIDATKIITSELPQIKVIGLSMYDEVDRADAMLEAGAATYVSKSGEIGKLLGEIRAVCASAK